MTRTVHLFDPHPGFAGAAVPLPKVMKEAADKLDGKSMSLDKAVEDLTGIAEQIGGTIEIVDRFNFIKFEMEAKPPYICHTYRLIRYK